MVEAKDLEAAAVRVQEARSFLKVNEKQVQLGELERRLSNPAVWDDHVRQPALFRRKPLTCAR